MNDMKQPAKTKNTKRHKILVSLALIGASLGVIASPAHAIDSKTGYKNCNNRVAYTRASWVGSAVAAVSGPGGSTGYYYNGSPTAYKVATRSGSYSGYWTVSTDTYHLSFGGTYAACRNYG